MIRAAVVVVAIAAVASADPYAGWDAIQPKSKSAHLDVQRLAITSAVRITALDAHDRPVVDDGTTTSHLVAGKLVELATGTTPKSPVYWWRGSTLMAVDKTERVFTIDTPAPASDGHSVQVGGSLYYAGNDKLVRYDIASKKTTEVADIGRDYEGAIATDGKKVFVADRESLWSYDPVKDRKTTLPQQFYWPGELAAHDGRFLIDIHGHGSAVFRATDKEWISLGAYLALPSSNVGWSNDTALVLQTHAPLAAGSDDVGDYADAADALTCWRSARDPSDGKRGVLHTLYRSAPGVHLCDVQVHGASLAWLEYRGEDYCKNPEALVTARIVGTCE